jgi:hypothetical protein
MQIKKFLLFLLIGTAFFWGGGMINQARAQSELLDYQYQYEKYSQSYQEFLRARDEYRQYESLNSKEELIAAFKDVLIQRAETQRTYWFLLRKKMRDNPGLVIGTKNRFINYLTAEIIFLEEHKQQVASIKNPTLQDYINVSKVLEARSDNFSPSIYKILSYLLIGKIEDYHSDATSINTLFDEEISYMPDDQQTFLYSWVEEAKSQTLIAQDKKNRAVTLAQEIGNEKKEKNIKELYQQVVSTLLESKRIIEKALSYQRELLRKIGEL